MMRQSSIIVTFIFWLSAALRIGSRVLLLSSTSSAKCSLMYTGMLFLDSKRFHDQTRSLSILDTNLIMTGHGPVPDLWSLCMFPRRHLEQSRVIYLGMSAILLNSSSLVSLTESWILKNLRLFSASDTLLWSPLLGVLQYFRLVFKFLFFFDDV